MNRLNPHPQVKNKPLEKVLSLIRQFVPTQYAGIEQGLDLVFPDKKVLLQTNSRLGRQGVPLEWAMVWPGNNLRFSADPAPDAAPLLRSQLCLDLCSSFHHALAQQMIATVQHWQQTNDCRYGAWIGVRDQKGKAVLKVYLEVPEEAAWQPKEKEWSQRSKDFPNRGLKLTMIGLAPQADTYELYYRIPFLYPHEIGKLQNAFGFKDRGNEFKVALEKLSKSLFRLRDPIPSTNMGCSVSISMSGQPQVFTLYSFAHSLLGSDVEIRNKNIEFLQKRNYAKGLYQSLSSPVKEWPDTRLTWHGMVGFAAADQGSLHFTTGISYPQKQSPSWI